MIIIQKRFREERFRRKHPVLLPIGRYEIEKVYFNANLGIFFEFRLNFYKFAIIIS